MGKINAPLSPLLIQIFIRLAMKLDTVSRVAFTSEQTLRTMPLKLLIHPVHLKDHSMSSNEFIIVNKQEIVL